MSGRGVVRTEGERFAERLRRGIVRRVLGWIFFATAMTAILGLVGAIFLYLRTQGDYVVARTVAQDPSLPRVSVRGRLFHAECAGAPDAPVVLVLHGGPGNDYRYLLGLRELAVAYRVCFYDQRGTGLSPRVDPSELTLDTMLEDLDAMVEYFGGGRPVHLVGHSWGAMLASGYLGRRPEKVRGAVLAEPGMLTTEKAREFEALMKAGGSLASLALLRQAVVSGFRSLHVGGPDEQARGDFFFWDLFASLSPESSPLAGYFCNPADARRLEAWRYSWTSSRHIPDQARNAKGEIEIDLVQGVERFTRPVLFLCGACDRLIGAEYQSGHMRYFAEPRLEVVAGAGHAMFNDQPQAALAIVTRYLAEIDGGGA